MRRPADMTADDLLAQCMVRSGTGAETRFPALTGRRILVFENVAWTPHTPTSGEIALRFAEQGNDVTLVLARGVASYYEDRALSSRAPLFRYSPGAWLPYHRLKSALRGSAVAVMDLRVRGAARALPVATLAELRAYTEDGWDIGLAVASSLISHTRSTDFSVATNRRALDAAYNSSRLTFHAARRLMQERRPDLVVLFNGRFTVTRAVLRAAESLGLPYLVHERGCDAGHFILLPFMPHLVDRRNALMLRLREQEDAEAAARLAERFYARRRAGGAKEWVSFANWKPQALSAEIERLGAPPFTFLVSSEDELSAVGLDRSADPYPSQIAAIHAAADACARRGHPFVVRVHPHFAQKAPADLQALLARMPPSAAVVGPTDNVDTYALIARSRGVFSYGSTAGIEADYMGVPHLLLSRAAYEGMPGLRRARTQADVDSFVDAPSPSPHDGAITYGWYMESFGIRHRDYRPTSLFSGTLRGRAFGRRSLLNPRELRWSDRLLARLAVLAERLRRAVS